MKKVDFLKSNAFNTVEEIVDGMLIREGDIAIQTKKPLYMSLAKEVYDDLNLSVIRKTDRVLVKVTRAPFPHIFLPDTFLRLSSIAALNDAGLFDPIFINTQIPDDYVDMGASKICGCDCGCNSPDCSNIRNYEVITSDVIMNLPNGDPKEFKKTIRKKVMNDGRFVMEVTEPQKIFTNNVHTSTELRTSESFLCQLELKECGCIKEHEENHLKIVSVCDATTIDFDCGCPVVKIVPNEANGYKVLQEGNRIRFDAHFPYDAVLVRFYADKRTRDLQVPYFAKKSMRSGIKAEDALWNGTSGELSKWKKEHKKNTDDLFILVTDIKLSNFYKNTIPARKVV